MKCPFCGFEETKVIDSRPAEDNSKIRRRRECLKCKERFTTYEVIETLPIIIVKKDSSREYFDRNKLIGGMLKACEKRPVALETIVDAVDRIEQSLQSTMEREIPSSRVGELAMEELKKIDDVAYVRFASVYRQFKDINTFSDEVNRVLEQRIKEEKTKSGL